MEAPGRHQSSQAEPAPGPAAERSTEGKQEVQPVQKTHQLMVLWDCKARHTNEWRTLMTGCLTQGLELYGSSRTLPAVMQSSMRMWETTLGPNSSQMNKAGASPSLVRQPERSEAVLMRQLESDDALIGWNSWVSVCSSSGEENTFSILKSYLLS